MRREIGVIGMKVPAKGRIFDKGGIIDIKEAISYILSLPVSTIIVGIGEIPELEENIEIAKEFVQLSADEMLAIEKKAEPHYQHLQYFKAG